MCGIYCCFHQKNASIKGHQYNLTKKLIQNRGPDGFSELKVEYHNGWEGIFAGSTLWTQGSCIKIQPHIAENGSIFLWNGDKYDQDTPLEDCDINDSEEVFSNILIHGIQYLMNVNGPYSFIYFNVEEKELWFGRDVLGRHSLLWSLTKNNIKISSVGISSHENNQISEIPPYGFYRIKFSSSELCVNIYPWYHMPNLNEINLELPFSVEEHMRHKLLNPIYNEEWLDTNPEDEQIIKYSGVLSEEGARSVFQTALANSPFLDTTKQLKKILFASIKKRIKTQPRYCKNCINSTNECKHSKIGILFSGGLDSAILALISDNFVDENEPIDLFNVSFQRSLNHKYKDVPDRMNGLNTLKELQSLCPNRIWNFIEINISQDELNHERENHISKLIIPLNSIMDDSLGCALWFAARGRGYLNGSEYYSPARVILLGMGADEMFGGYTSQRKAFASDGWKGLGRELCRSLSNIGERNLGRDNRVTADHGRQPRTPYLDEEVVAFVSALPPWQRCFLPPCMPLGIGDKFALRLLAWELGLRHAAILPKKALQFGSHIANPKEKAHLKSDRLSYV